MRIFLSIITLLILSVSSYGQIVISQYIETSSGTTPKGIEIWNTSASDIDLSVTPITVFKGTNGATPALDFTADSGILPAGNVLVAGTSDMSATTLLQGCADMLFFVEPFTFNGDDALELYLNGVLMDVFGEPGVDPGSSWTGGGVDTRNNNIGLQAGITTGDLDGWSDPSERFENIAGGQDLTDFGIPVGGCPAVMPVELIAFSASTLKNKDINLFWQTSIEINNDVFVIERSNDSKYFEAIGEVSGFGNSAILQEYTFIDKFPELGVNYYRLKQMDYDGKYEYSDVVSIKNNSSNLKVAPTSTYDLFTITVDQEAYSDIYVYNIAGQMVTTLSKVSGVQTIDVSTYSKGTYIVTVVTNGITQTEKVVKL